MEPAVRVVLMKKDGHKGIKSIEFGLELLKYVLISEVAFFDNSEHKLGMLIPESFASDRHHKLEKRSDSLTFMSLEKVMHSAQHFRKLAIFTVPSVVALEFLKEVLAHFAQCIFTYSLAT